MLSSVAFGNPSVLTMMLNEGLAVGSWGREMEKKRKEEKKKKKKNPK